jgi:maleate cis-trans isomerase
MFYGSGSAPLGTVGLVKPTYRPGSLEETIRLLPEGVGVVPMHAGVRTGDTQEFHDVLRVVEQRVAELAELGVSAIYVEGAPPGMLMGYDADHQLARELSERYSVPVSLASMAALSALRHLGAQRVIGLSYLTQEQHDAFGRYLADAGLDVLVFTGIESSFREADRITAEEVRLRCIELVREYPQADAIYLLGGAWRILRIVEPLEQELGIAVCAGIQASVWEILKLLGLKHSIQGYGRLLL